MGAFKTILTKLPASPGIYKFFNISGKIIYIGKSVHLKNRVNSYFKKNAKLNFAKKKMVNEVSDIEYILTNNETESLVLEHTLVKKHQPKYNILLKDDKNYLYIKITSEAIPRVITTRQKNNSGEYFGPYLSGGNVRNILKVVKKSFGYRSCNLIFTKEEGKFKFSQKSQLKIPCIDYYIKRCSAPCLLKKENIDQYTIAIEDIKKVLSGNSKDLLTSLENKMKAKAKTLEFEQAQEIKNDIIALTSLEESQTVRDFIDGDYDVINYIQKYEKTFVGIIEIRKSKITGFRNIEVQAKLEETEDEILLSILENIEIEHQQEKEKIKYILPKVPQTELIYSFLSNIEVPKIGGKLDMLKLCYKNIYEYAYKKYIDSLSVKSGSKRTQESILEKLGYEVKNKDIVFECNDISHISGSHTVASRSVIENGKPNSSLYRKYTIKTLENTQIDDFDSLREVFDRRLKELVEKRNLPDLIIIDGGKGQLSSVMEVLENFKYTYKDFPDKLSLLDSLQLCSLAKQEEEIFLPYCSESIIIEKDSAELRLIQKIRDEAHRFAITFNREKRIKATTKNILESLPGIGPKSRKKLLTTFGSVENLKNVHKEELKQHITQKQIQTLEDHGII